MFGGLPNPYGPVAEYHFYCNVQISAAALQKFLDVYSRICLTISASPRSKSEHFATKAYSATGPL